MVIHSGGTVIKWNSPVCIIHLTTLDQARPSMITSILLVLLGECREHCGASMSEVTGGMWQLLHLYHSHVQETG